MSSFSFKQAFGKEKPHSSITDWVEILSGPGIEEEAYDGIPELVDSINLQASGPAEASRALRKKLKHGGAHQQYRALVLLKALVENCGSKFQRAVADSQLTDALRLVASDSGGNKRVKKKLLLVLTAWREQYKDDPSMTYFANLHRQCRVSEGGKNQEVYQLLGVPNVEEEQKKFERAKAKQSKKAAKELAAQEEAERLKASKPRTRRVPFDFERDKPRVLESIVEASQATSNLMNAITLVNLQKETLEENARVQVCLAKAKQARKIVMRYTQLVENEDLIGTLIESTERVSSALETYDELVSAGLAGDTDATDALTSKLAATTLARNQSAETLAEPENPHRGSTSPPQQHPGDLLHPDLEDLQFGTSSSRLPPPIQPSKAAYGDNDIDDDEIDRRASLSDFSDYESSDEERHNARAGPSTRKAYVTVSDDEDDIVAQFTPPKAQPTKVEEEDDPFADPFADSVTAKR